ncbi:MAG: response regulator transcription factor [Prolixibacteraceae bacterium]|jgi:DNA-binding NarL/FixJ family response regulator|nr:response regulator transcription factor [Prolixibacteraceae bacterium]
MENEITVMIIDDSWIVRQGIRSMLSGYKHIRIVAEGESNKDLGKIESIRPNVILLDIELNDGLCFNEMKQIKEKFPDIGVIILSHYKDVCNIVKSIQSNANAYLPKDCDPRELITAIEVVKNSKGLFLGETIAPETLQDCFSGSVSTKNCKPYHLTDREIEIIELLAKGFQTKEIASQLSVHPTTIESHKENIKQKLGKNTVIEIVVFAYKNGLLKED